MSGDWLHLDAEGRRAVRWAAAQLRIARLAAVIDHPARLAAVFLSHARACRLSASRDRHPGRVWWARNARRDLAKAHALRAQVAS